MMELAEALIRFVQGSLVKMARLEFNQDGTLRRWNRNGNLKKNGIRRNKEEGAGEE